MDSPLVTPAWPAVWPAQGLPVPGAGELHLWWMSLAEPAGEWAQLAGWLDAGEAARAARFHFEIHRRRFVAAHGQMRRLLGAYACRAPGALCFDSDERGKPRLADAAGAPVLSFNLSHSGDEALLGVADGTAIGVDLEVQRHLPELDAIARGHFSTEEMRSLHALPPSQRPDAFFAGWTRKEACVKALGVGLSVPLDSVEVALHPDQPAALRALGGSQAAAQAWTLWAARPTPQSWAAAAIQVPQATVKTFALR